MSLSDTASLLTESHIVIDSSTDECNDSKITLVQIHLLPAKLMNSKLTNIIETKNSSLEFRLIEIII